MTTTSEKLATHAEKADSDERRGCCIRMKREQRWDGKKFVRDGRSREMCWDAERWVTASVAGNPAGAESRPDDG